VESIKELTFCAEKKIYTNNFIKKVRDKSEYKIRCTYAI
jgi:hypothetical protein